MIQRLVVSRLSPAASRSIGAASPALKMRDALANAPRSFSARPPGDIDGGFLNEPAFSTRRACFFVPPAHTMRVRRQTDEIQQPVLTLRKPGMNSPKAPWEFESAVFNAPGGGVDAAKIQGAVKLGYEAARRDHVDGSMRLVHWTEKGAFNEHALRHHPESESRIRAVIDVGTGTAQAAFRWTFNQVRVVATDISEQQVIAVRAQAKQAQVADDALALEVVTAQGLEGVDADHCMHVRAARVPCYMSAVQFSDFLGAAYKLLGPGGTVYLSTYEKHQGWNQHTAASQVMRLSSLTDLHAQVSAHGFMIERLSCEVNGFEPRMQEGRLLDAIDEPIDRGMLDAMRQKIGEDVEIAERDPRLLGCQVVVHVLLRK